MKYQLGLAVLGKCILSPIGITVIRSYFSFDAAPEFPPSLVTAWDLTGFVDSPPKQSEVCRLLMLSRQVVSLKR